MSCKVFDYRLIKLPCCGRGLLYKVGSYEPLSKRNVSKDTFHSFVRKGVFSSNQFKVGHFGLHKVRATAWPIDVSRGYEESIPQYAIHSDSPDALRYEGEALVSQAHYEGALQRAQCQVMLRGGVA